MTGSRAKQHLEAIKTLLQKLQRLGQSSDPEVVHLANEARRALLEIDHVIKYVKDARDKGV